MKKLLSIIGLFGLFVSNVYAQENDSLQYEIQEVEITAKYVSPVSVAGQTMPMRRIPQSVSVINPVRIREMNMTTIDQAMQMVTGVTTIANDIMRSQYKSRGYGMSIMTDGLPAYNSLALSQQFDLSFFEQIEVLRGVSGILQGVPDGQSLGGVINLVKKKTKEYLTLNTTVSIGSWKNFRGEIDLNAPITKDGKLRTRWVLFLNNRNFFYDRSSMNKSGVYGVIDWNATRTTAISLSYAYQHSRGDVLYNGLPAFRATSDDNSRKSLPVDRTFNPTPDWDYTEWDTNEVMLAANQKLSDNWDIKGKIGIKLQNQENKFGFAGTVTAADSTSNYQRGYNDEKLPRVVSAIDLSGKFSLFQRTQHIFVGVNYENFVDDKKNLSAYYKVKFGNPNLVPDFEVPYDKLNHSKMRVRQGGIYAQLRLSLLDNLNAQLGTRMSSVFASMYDFNNEKWNEVIKEEYKLTPFAGITYDPIDPLTLYTSYSSIFVPQTERREDGSMLDPRTGFQVELGAKSQFLNDRLACNIALFYLQDNGRAYKTSPTPTYVNGGKVENKGFEVEINAYPYRGLELSTSYTYLDTKIAKSADGNEGLAFSPIEPKHSFKFFSAYRFNNGISLGFNLLFQSTTYASVLTPERCQDPYALVNAFVSYDINKKLGLYFNCNNITDCVYYSRVGGNGDFYGDPRNIMLSLKCSF